MKNEKLICEFVRSSFKYSNFSFSTFYWRKSFEKMNNTNMSEESQNFHKKLCKEINVIFPSMYVDKVSTTFDKNGRAYWKIDFNCQVKDGAVFLFVVVGLNKKYIGVRLMASKEILESDFDLLNLINVNNLYKTQRIIDIKQSTSSPISHDDEYEDNTNDSFKKLFEQTKPTQQPYATYHH